MPLMHRRQVVLPGNQLLLSGGLQEGAKQGVVEVRARGAEEATGECACSQPARGDRQWMATAGSMHFAAVINQAPAWQAITLLLQGSHHSVQILLAEPSLYVPAAQGRQVELPAFQAASKRVREVSGEVSQEGAGMQRPLHPLRHNANRQSRSPISKPAAHNRDQHHSRLLHSSPCGE